MEMGHLPRIAHHTDALHSTHHCVLLQTLTSCFFTEPAIQCQKQENKSVEKELSSLVHLAHQRYRESSLQQPLTKLPRLGAGRRRECWRSCPRTQSRVEEKWSQEQEIERPSLPCSAGEVVGSACSRWGCRKCAVILPALLTCLPLHHHLAPSTLHVTFLESSLCYIPFS